MTTRMLRGPATSSLRRWWLAPPAAIATAICWIAWPTPPVPVAPIAHATAPTPIAVDDERVAVRALAPTPAPLAATATPSFDEFVEQLVTIGLATSRLDAEGDREGAAASDEEARRMLVDLIAAFADCDQRALSMLIAHAAPAKVDLEGQLRQQVLDLLLRAGLARRHAAATNATADGATTDADGTSGERATVDAMVTAMLTAMQSPTALRDDLSQLFGERQLVEQPYLGRAHERAVLDLVAASGAQRFPPAVATALLVTLWHNLQRTGQRSSDELAGLALLLLQDGNASERRAAGRQLLPDERYRAVVLQHLRASKDAAQARELAMVAAQQLPAGPALEVLATAVAIGSEPTAAFLVLAQRDLGAMQQAYEERLAGDVEPRVRDLLIAGAGFAATPVGVQLAQAALTNDPDVGVRVRAAFALTANGTAAQAEAAVAALLDDPHIANDGPRLGAIVHTLENLVQRGLVNELDRLAQRLRMQPALDVAARSDLERILARGLPGGQTSR